MSQPRLQRTERINGHITRILPSGTIPRPVISVVRMPMVNGSGQLVQLTSSIRAVTSQPSTSLGHSLRLARNDLRGSVEQQQSVCVALVTNGAPTPNFAALAYGPPMDHVFSPIDICIRNVVSVFKTCCHLNLHTVAMKCCNVIYERTRGVLIMQIRRPRCFVKAWSSGKVVVSGNSSEELARRNSRGIARLLYKCLGPQVRFADYRVTNIMATCKMPFGIRIRQIAIDFPKDSIYEPELSVGLLWRSNEPKATLRIHSTGSITITGAESQQSALRVMELLYPLLLRYKCPASVHEPMVDQAGSYPLGEGDEEDEVDSIGLFETFDYSADVAK